MGGACLRGHRHPRPAGRAGGPAARGRRQGDLSDQPDPARPHPGTERLRAGCDPDSVDVGHAQTEPDTVRVGVTLGDGGDQRRSQSVSLAYRYGHAVSVAERQSKGVELALAGRSFRR
jgi:hypothetical protein